MAACCAGVHEGEDCGRRADVEFGRVALCAEHLNVLDAGRENEVAMEQLYYLKKWLSEAASSPRLSSRVRGLLEQVQQEADGTRDVYEHRLREAGDSPPEDEE